VGFVFATCLQIYLLQNRSFGCLCLAVLSSLSLFSAADLFAAWKFSVLALFLVVVGRLYFRPWVGFAMMVFCSGLCCIVFSAVCLCCNLCVSFG
jgi:hypothetical protein